MNPHGNGAQQPLWIAAGDNRPAPGDNFGVLEALQRNGHGLFRAIGKQQLPPAIAVTFDRYVLIEAPLVEQQPCKVVGWEPVDG